MSGEMITIREYAEIYQKTKQAVYQQMKTKENAVALEGHISFRKINNKKTKVLDEIAVEILNESSKKTPNIIMNTERKEEVVQLRIDNKNLLIKVGELQETLLKEKDQVKQLQLEKIELLESKVKKHWWNKT